MTELEVLYKDLDRQEQRLYKQLQQIERLERELAESREECRRLREALVEISIDGMIRPFPLDGFGKVADAIMQTKYEVGEIARKALAPKVEDK